MFNRVQPKKQQQIEEKQQRKIPETLVETVSEPMQKYDVRFSIPGSPNETGRLIAIDCEMVQCEDQYGNPCQKLARLSVVNYNGYVVLNQLYRPQLKIVNFLTRISGITYPLIKDAPIYDAEQKQKIIDLFKDKTIVGHSLKGDFEALELDITLYQIRDISTIQFLKNEGKTQSLKKLVFQNLGQNIQFGQHDSAIDARSALFIYRKFRNEINYEYKKLSAEQNIKKFKNKKKNQKNAEKKKLKKVKIEEPQ